jgi:glycosyltransferase involved in cell wall biosynthesis
MAMTSSPKATIIIPAFNEAGSIARVTQETVDTFARSSWTPFEVIIVDDGSSDATSQLADAIAAADPRVRVVHHEGNKGFGIAIRSGIAQARGLAVSYLPGDGQLPPAEVIALLEALTPDRAMVVGRRTRKATLVRDVVSAAFLIVASIVLGRRLTTTPSHFAAKADVIRDMPLSSASGTVITEIMLRCQRRGLAVGYCPVCLRQREAGESKMANWRNALVIFHELWRLRKVL